MTIENLRRQYSISDSREDAILFACEHWISLATESIKTRGKFNVALSGGSTPRAIYEKLASDFKNSVDWSLIWFYFSDERSVSVENEDNNYHTALNYLFSKVPVNMHQVFRMKAEEEIEANAQKYEELIKENIRDAKFDLIMLGVGDDGHTASLFPKTEALKEKERFVLANFVPQKNTWRMTFTYPLINHAKSTVVYSFGKNKAEISYRILIKGEDYPAHLVGIPLHPALWVLDPEAGEKIPQE